MDAINETLICIMILSVENGVIYLEEKEHQTFLVTFSIMLSQEKN